MLIPVRCFTCNKVLGNKWELYEEYKNSGMSEKDIFEKLGLTRYCCTRMLTSHVDMFELISLHVGLPDKVVVKKRNEVRKLIAR